MQAIQSRVIQALSPAADRDPVPESKPFLQALSLSSDEEGMQLQDLGFSSAEQDEHIPVHDMGKLDGEGFHSSLLHKVATDEEKHTTHKKPPHSPLPLPNLLLFSPTPRPLTSSSSSSNARFFSSKSPIALMLGSSRNIQPPNLEASPELSRFQSIWKFDEEGGLVKKDSSADDVKKEVDLVACLQAGTVLLKFGEKGPPHFRWFAVNSALDTLLWLSGSKTFESTQIPVKNINDIKFGLGDKGLRVKGSRQYQNLAFTIVYNNYQNTLELVAKDSMELQIWVNGLIALHNAAVKNEPAPVSLPMQVIVSESNPSALFDKNPEVLSRLEKRFNKLSADCEVIVAPFADNVVNTISDDLRRLKIDSLSGASSDLSYELWKVSVYLEALDHILHTPREASRPVIIPLAEMES
jgi:hypothetical protein